METPAKTPRATQKKKRGLRVRKWSRIVHRDLGYFSVGLTFIYAASGLAVNHIADWEPNFREVKAVHQLELPLPTSDEEIARMAARVAQREEPIRESFRDGATDLEVAFDRGSLRINLNTGKVLEEGQEPRFFLRIANWLHLNRGKTAWTIIADAYALFLLTLAATGLWMLPGKKGIWGRAGIIALSGALVPTLYVVLSGGP